MKQTSESFRCVTPQRRKHSHVLSINADPAMIFPMLCPVSEIDWCEGWIPDWVISKSGHAEPGCVFQTPGEPAPSIWYVSKYEPDSFVQMIKVTPEHSVCVLEISLHLNENVVTNLQISYEFTAIAEAGNEFLTEFTNDWYLGFMRNWEDEMNQYLAKTQT